MEFLRKNFTLAVFAVFVFGLALIIYSQGDALWATRLAWRYEIASNLGIVGLSALILVYLRSVLKPLMKYSALLQRILFYLNLIHPYLGMTALAALFLHGYLMAGLVGNILVRLALYIIAWQVFLGFVLKSKYAPVLLKRKALFLHTQILAGILIFALAFIGHQLFN